MEEWIQYLKGGGSGRVGGGGGGEEWVGMTEARQFFIIRLFIYSNISNHYEYLYITYI